MFLEIQNGFRKRKNLKLQPKRQFLDEIFVYTTYASGHIEITCMFKRTNNTFEL